jgi:GTP pyrophosphokinase
VTVHRQDCYNVAREDEKERLVKVEWGQADSLYPVRVQVEAWDRVGLVRDISAVVAEEKVNIANMSLAEHDNGTTSLYLTLETRGLAQLGRLLARIETVRGMISVSRVGDESTVKSSSSI